MPLFKRSDGTRCSDLPKVRAIMPTVTQSVVFFEQEIDLTRTLPFLQQFNAAHGG